MSSKSKITFRRVQAGNVPHATECTWCSENHISYLYILDFLRMSRRLPRRMRSRARVVFRGLATGVLVALMLLIVTRAAYSSPTDSIQAPADSSAEAATSLAAFPTFFYTPQTSFGGGGAGVYFFPLGAERASSVQGSLFGTVRAQFQMTFASELNLADGRQRITTDLRISTFPDVFFGLGPDTAPDSEEDFTSNFADAFVQAEQRIAGGLLGGVRARFRTERITSVEEGRRLDSQAIPGQDASTIVGIGPVLAYDTRDRSNFPSEGRFVTAYALHHPGWLGSTFHFTRGVLDARQYVPLGGDHVIALQAYVEAISGTAPFNVLPQMGGSEQLRGYREGRFRDDVAAVAQAEYRFPIGGRFAGAVFGSVGDVSPTAGSFAAGGPQAGGGLGLRFRLNDQGTHLRLDYAVGFDDTGFYITGSQPF